MNEITINNRGKIYLDDLRKSVQDENTVKLYRGLLGMVCDYNLGDLEENTVKKVMETYSKVKLENPNNVKPFEDFMTGKNGHFRTGVSAEVFNKMEFENKN